MANEFDYICEGQMSIFDLLNEDNNEFHIGNREVKLIELFAGVGSQAMALRNLGIKFTHHRMVEIEKYACASYNAIHGTDFAPSDITKVKGGDLGITDTDKYVYILTYSFP